MAASKNWAHLGADGSWSDPNNWDPQGIPGTTDTVELGSGSPYTVTVDTAALVASVTVDAGPTTLLLTSGNSLTTSGGIDLGAGSLLGGTGTVAASGGISGSGTLEALGGTLDVSGTISSGVVLAIDTAAAATLKIEGTATSANAISLINDNQTLEIGSAGNLTISAHQDITGGHIILDGGTLTDMNGITLDGSSILSGHGTINTDTGSQGADEHGTGFFATYTPTIIASGGTLEFTGTANLYPGGSTQLIIDTIPGSTVKFDGLAWSNAPVINNSNQTLEIGSAGNLTLHNDPNITNGLIKLDGGTLNDNLGLTIGVGARLIGFGVVDTSAAATQGTGTIIASGGTLEFKADVDVYSANAFQIADGATLKFDTSVGNGNINPTITFDGAHGTLDLSGMNNESTNFNAYVSGFQAGDQIKITEGGSGPESHTSSYDGTYTTVTFSDGNTVDGTVKFVGDYSHAQFSISDTGTIDTITMDAICFMAGTLIRTPDGEVAVETLKRGDLLLTSDGQVKPVSWLGRQTVSTRFADPIRVWPIRIKAGALADNVPSRDLLLSPDHAVLVEGALVHAGALVNGTSIVREKIVPQIFTYYHVELDDHSLIFAENTQAETFIDNVDRMNFDNWDEHQALYPNGRPINELPYPRAKAHRQVPVATRVKLGERAQVIGATVGVAAA
jgi:hypothetical protein